VRAGILALIALCFSLDQLRDAECKIYCRTSAGYDSGMWIVKQRRCWCGDLMDQERLSEKKIMAPKKITRVRKSVFNVPMSFPSENFKLPWE
jgi:hypothetical protein